MNTQKITAALALAAEKAEGFDVIALTIDTMSAADGAEQALASVATATDNLRNMLTANAVLIAADIQGSPRGRQAEIAELVAGMTGAKANTVTKRLGRIANCGLLIVAFPKADVLELFAFANRANAAEMKAALAGKAAPTGAPKKPKAEAGKKQAQTRTLRQQIEAASKENAKVLALAAAALEGGTLSPADAVLFVKSLEATLNKARSFADLAEKNAKAA